MLMYPMARTAPCVLMTRIDPMSVLHMSLDFHNRLSLLIEEFQTKGLPNDEIEMVLNLALDDILDEQDAEHLNIEREL